MARDYHYSDRMGGPTGLGIMLILAVIAVGLGLYVCVRVHALSPAEPTTEQLRAENVQLKSNLAVALKRCPPPSPAPSR